MLAQHTRGNLCVQIYIQKGCGLWTLSCDCPSLPTETLKWLSSLPILMQESFWWWQCSGKYNLPPSSPTSIPSSLFSPSLISLMVSVDVKHHVYLLTTSIPPSPLSPSLINLMVSVDVKHHVYLLTTSIPPSPLSPSLINLMISVDVKHHVYLLTASIPPSPLSPSLINLMVSVDVKHHVYLLTTSIPPSPLSPSLINLMVSVDVKHHALCRVRELHVWSIFITLPYWQPHTVLGGICTILGGWMLFRNEVVIAEVSPHTAVHGITFECSFGSVACRTEYIVTWPSRQ